MKNHPALQDEFIKLGQAIKEAGAESGVEAKRHNSERGSIVNGEIDTRRGRKLYKGDTPSSTAVK